MKKKKDDRHRMGKWCGYTLLEDGSICPAPQYKQAFDQIQMERKAVDDLLQAVTSQCNNILLEINKRSSKIWNDICEDYGLDRKSKLSYDPNKETITITK